jgi:serine/threonine protein phosphatase PrpC
LFGVLDGVSPPSPEYAPKKFGEFTDGEMVVRLAEDFLSFLPKILPQMPALRQFILELNKLVGEKQEGTPPGELSGAVFAFALVKKDSIEIIQIGDCYAVVETIEGNIIVSPNQVRRHDEAMNGEIDRLIREISQEKFRQPLEALSEKRLNEVRGKMWNRFRDTLIEARRQENNNPQSPRGFGILNGDPRLTKMLWEKKFPLSSIKSILLFTDGIIPWAKMKKMDDDEVKFLHSKANSSRMFLK